MKRWIRFLLMLSIYLICITVMMVYKAGSAHASSPENKEKCGNGAIRLYMAAGDAIAVGGDVRLVRVAAKSDHRELYTYCSDFVHCGISLSEILKLQDEDLAEQLAAYAERVKVSGRHEAADKDGNVYFDGLDPGVYLLIQDQAAEGFVKMNPFIVVLAGNEILDASPKLLLVKEPESESDQPPKETPDLQPLPITGQTRWPEPVLLGTGIILITAGYYINKKGSRERALRKDQRKERYVKNKI